MQQLSYTECVKIQIYLDEKKSHREIAIKLARSNRTISQEIKKYWENWTYNAKIAWVRRKTKRALLNIFHTKIMLWSELEKYILDKIMIYRSPEQIAWRLRFEESKTVIGKDSIYKFIYSHHPWLIKKFFRRRGKKYTSHREKVSYLYNRRSIHDRPDEVNLRQELGHREWDTVWGCNRKWWVVTYVERVSWLLLAWVLIERKAPEIVMKTFELFNNIPEWLRKTVTYDNWREFTEHYIIEQICHIITFFADPYCSWQRWTNENTNWLLRQFYPKKTNLAILSQQELDTIVTLINNRPRKRLWYLSPIEFLAKNYCVLLK